LPSCLNSVKLRAGTSPLILVVPFALWSNEFDKSANPRVSSRYLIVVISIHVAVRSIPEQAECFITLNRKALLVCVSIY